MTPTGPARLCFCLRYADAPAAIAWLEAAFGYVPRLVVPAEDGGVAHAQLVFGNSMVMLGSAREDDFGRTQIAPRDAGGRVTASPYIVVADVDAHHARALAAGADVVTAPADQPHGGRFYACTDPEGHLWSFGSYDPWLDG